MQYGFSFNLRDNLSSEFSRMASRVNQAYSQMANNQQRFNRHINSATNSTEQLHRRLSILGGRYAITLETNSITNASKLVDNLSNRLSRLRTRQTPTGGSGNGETFGQSLIGATGLGRFAGLNPYVAGGLAVGAVAGIGIKGGSELEKNELLFKQFTGSLEKGKKAVSELMKYAALTSYKNSEILQNGAVLAQNVPYNQLFKKMQVFGDISGGSSERLGRNITAYSQLKGKGKLSAEEAQQFEENLVPIRNTLAKLRGVSRGVLDKLVSDGKIGFNEVDRALTSLTTKGGLYYKMAENSSKLLENRFNTMVDTFATELNKFSMSQFPVLNNMVDWGIRFGNNLAYTRGGLQGLANSVGFFGQQFNIMTKGILGNVDTANLSAKILGRTLYTLSAPFQLISSFTMVLKNDIWSINNAFLGLGKTGAEVMENFSRMTRGKGSIKNLFDTPKASSYYNSIENERKSNFRDRINEYNAIEKNFQASQTDHTKSINRRNQRKGILTPNQSQGQNLQSLTNFQPSDMSSTSAGKTANLSSSTVTGGSVKSININSPINIAKIEVINTNGNIDTKAISEAIHKELTATISSASMMGAI